MLLLHLLGRDRSWLFLHGEEGLGDADATPFDVLVMRREAGEPLSLIHI